MKNYLFITAFICFLTTLSYSQQVTNTEFKTKTLQVFQNLDKNKIPHGILLDFEMEFTNLKVFNGTLTDSTFTTSQTMSDIYKTIIMCRVRQVTTGFITPEEYTTRWYTQRTNGVIILSGNYFKYSRFADNAYPSKLNYANNQFTDKFVGSTWQNPYEEKQLFAVAPAIASYKGLNLKVKLPSNLFLSNYPTTVQNIQVDFSDGLGFRIVGYDQLINVNYTQPNTYTWKYLLTLTNGQTMLSYSKVAIENGLNAVELVTPCTNCPSNVANQTLALNSSLNQYFKKTVTSTTQYLGSNARATIYIKYANGGNTIRKPLIVAEGFDDGIILKPEQEAGSNNIDGFLQSTLSQFSQSFALESEINSYDVIYVDWNNGVTFLQRNAFALEEVIKWVNDNKTTTTKNVIIGQSMGGLIARYALKDMENRGLPHDTRLYVSHDAPHLGANTPVSAQLSARHLRNLYVSSPIPYALGELVIPMIYNFAEGFSSIINYLGGNTSVPTNITPLRAFSLADTPAARQMNYNWVGTNYQISNVIHDSWQNELALKGYPNQTRNIAIANGSECGVTQVDNGNILSFQSENKMPWYYLGIVDALIGVAASNPLIVITSLLPGSSSWKSDFQSKYITNLNENKNIYKGYLGYKKKIFWFIPVSIAITDLSINQPAGINPYDIYGGGNFRTPTSSLPIDGVVSNSFGFIPTASSLDIGRWTTPINDGDYRLSFVGGQPPVAPKNSPFQNFVTGFVQNNPLSSNSRHISFNTRNGNWLKRELSPTPTIPVEYSDCSYICKTAEITGTSSICTSGSYSVPVGGTYYNWSITTGSSLVIMTGNGSANITLTAVPNESGLVTLSVTYGDNFATCGYVTISKSLWVGAPSFAFEYTYYDIQPTKSILCIVSAIPELSLEQQGVTTVTFKKNNTTAFLPKMGLFCTRTTQPLCIEATATNACGSNTLKYNCDLFRQVASTNYFRVYPNPAKDIVTIDLVDDANKPSIGRLLSGELFDLMGQSKSKIVIKDNKATFSVNSLTKGVYVVKIKIDDQVESHQIAVE